MLRAAREKLGLTRVTLVAYPDVGSNNADLPRELRGGPKKATSLERIPDTSTRFTPEKLLSRTSLVLALTERSSTAPLKMLAPKLHFRAATLPGFSRAMFPALRLDFDAVSRRTLEMKQRLDGAESARLELEAEGHVHVLELDLRHRHAHASDGLIREPGMAANLPSGEAYVVPYEGERRGDPSRSHGTLPVELGGEIVVYRIEGNCATSVTSQGPVSEREAAAIREEPAYGNIAELGLGVLGEFGIEAVGSVLLDEKLGLHVAFGRSEHLGGVIAPSAFLDRARVIHVDRVYVPSAQAHVIVRRVSLRSADGHETDVIRDGRVIG